MGAEVLFYPTAIGSEPQDGDLDSASHWQRVMQGHAGANIVSYSTLSFDLLFPYAKG
jgi:N-carbamoylputrescine amidase